YHRGNAAKVAPPAVSSHTSLPSQTGPMVLMVTRRSMSSLPTKGISTPTPKSNPSRKKYPSQSTVMSVNHSCSRPLGEVVSSPSIVILLVDEFGDGRGFALAQHRLGNLGESNHQSDFDHGQQRVHRGETDQRRRHVSRGDERHGRRGLQESKYHPRLAADLGEDPASGVG